MSYQDIQGMKATNCYDSNSIVFQTQLLQQWGSMKVQMSNVYHVHVYTCVHAIV